MSYVRGDPEPRQDDGQLKVFLDVRHSAPLVDPSGPSHEVITVIRSSSSVGLLQETSPELYQRNVVLHF